MATKKKAVVKVDRKQALALLSGSRVEPPAPKSAKPTPIRIAKVPTAPVMAPEPRRPAPTPKPVPLPSFDLARAPAIPVAAFTVSTAPGLPEAVSTEVQMPKAPPGHNYTEPMLMLFQDIDRWYHCVVWEERDAKNKPVRLHIARRADTGQVIHEHRPPQEIAFVRETSAKTMPKFFLQYLKGKLPEVGGNSSAYEKLGVPKPVIVQEVAPERARDHDELYARAARLLEVPEDELRKKYGHLNPGLQMMNLRNRLRGKGYEV